MEIIKIEKNQGVKICNDCKIASPKTYKVSCYKVNYNLCGRCALIFLLNRARQVSRELSQYEREMSNIISYMGEIENDC